jgi:hypothetical protein
MSRRKLELAQPQAAGATMTLQKLTPYGAPHRNASRIGFQLILHPERVKLGTTGSPAGFLTTGPVAGPGTRTAGFGVPDPRPEISRLPHPTNSGQPVQLTRLYKIYINARSACSRNPMRQRAIEPLLKVSLQAGNLLDKTSGAILPETPAARKSAAQGASDAGLHHAGPRARFFRSLGRLHDGLRSPVRRH